MIHMHRTTKLLMSLSLLMTINVFGQPNAPVLKITQTAPNQLQLNWDPVPGALCYEIYQKGPSSEFWFLNRLSETSLDLTSLMVPELEPDIQLFQVRSLDECTPFPIPNDPIAWYPLDGNGNDFSGNELHLSQHGGTWVDGHLGQAIELNGTSNWLDHDFSAAFTPGIRGWSVSIWAWADFSENNLAMASWYRCGAEPECNSTHSAVYTLGVNNGLATWYMRDDFVVYDSPQHSDTLRTGRWHHIVGTIDESDRLLRLYVDGNLAETGTETIGTMSDGATWIPFSVGRIFRTDWGQPHAYFDGRLDDLRIYERALSLDEVRGLFTAVSPRAK